MRKIIEAKCLSGADIAIFKTNHNGPDFHVRYGLQVTSFSSLDEAYREFKDCISHALYEYFESMG